MTKFSAVFLLVTVTSCATVAQQQQGSTAPAPSTAAGKNNNRPVDTTWLFRSMTQMAIDFHRAIATGSTIRSCTSNATTSSGRPSQQQQPSGANVVFSPLSISSALSTLLVGSGGQTNEQLRAGLGYPAADALAEADIHATYKANLEALLGPNRGVEINYSNSLFGSAGLSVILYFYQDVQTYYRTAIRGVDFAAKPVQAMNEINRWVKEQTKGRITNILKSPPTPDTKLVLANAIYFNGAWESPFDANETRVEDFVVNDNDVVQVQMMTQTLDIPQVRDDDLQLQMIALPYQKAEFALYIVLPNNNGLAALADLESRLTEPIVDTLIRRMKTGLTRVSLPRLKLSWKAELTDVLARLGVCDAFNPATADLTRLAVEDGLFFSSVIHQADMEVNERGTVAAAATVISLSKSQPRAFKANHPFLFFIRDNRTGLPLFWGRVARPDAA